MDKSFFAFSLKYLTQTISLHSTRTRNLTPWSQTQAKKTYPKPNLRTQTQPTQNLNPLGGCAPKPPSSFFLTGGAAMRSCCNFRCKSNFLCISGVGGLPGDPSVGLGLLCCITWLLFCPRSIAVSRAWPFNAGLAYDPKCVPYNSTDCCPSA